MGHVVNTIKKKGRSSCVSYTGLFKMIVGVQLTSSNPVPNSGNNHHLTIPFESDMQSFKRQGACVSQNEGTNQNLH